MDFLSTKTRCVSTKQQLLSHDVIELDGQNKSKMTTELTVKLATDDWIVGKKIDQRQLYLAFKGKGSSNLLDINAEVDKIMASEFKNICLPP